MIAKLNIWGEDVELIFKKGNYCNNNNLAIQALTTDGMPYCFVTTNLNIACKENNAFIDDNNCPREIIEWLEENGYITCTYRLGRSGYCEYYEYKFLDTFLNNIKTID